MEEEVARHLKGTQGRQTKVPTATAVQIFTLSCGLGMFPHQKAIFWRWIPSGTVFGRKWSGQEGFDLKHQLMLLSWEKLDYERELGSLYCLFIPLDAFCNDNIQCLPLLMVPWSWTPEILNQESCKICFIIDLPNLCYPVLSRQHGWERLRIVSKQVIGQGKQGWQNELGCYCWLEMRWAQCDHVGAKWEGLAERKSVCQRGAAWEGLIHSLLALEMEGASR